MRITPAVVTVFYDFIEFAIMCVDLHTHSFFSDGTVSPATLVDMAVERSLSGIALTDHDTTEGVDEFLRLSKHKGLAAISGLEISCLHRGTSLHILGYGIQPDHPALNAWLDTLQQGRKTRNLEILEKLATLGIAITNKEMEELSQCGQAGRPHIARLLVDKGYAKNMYDAFSLYLGKNKPAWCRRFSYTAAESIDIIHQAGGLAVLAHPGQIDPAMKTQPKLINELQERELDGLEIFYPSHSKKMQNRLLSLAKKYDLLVTGGSDFHGDNRPGDLAGSRGCICPPDTIMDNIFNRLSGEAPQAAC